MGFFIGLATDVRTERFEDDRHLALHIYSVFGSAFLDAARLPPLQTSPTTALQG